MNFIDGPAKGVELLCRRAPIMLRVVQNQHGEWDALDQPDDTVRPGEKVYVYRMVGEPTHMYVCRSPRRLSGMMTLADYAVLPDQPGDEHTRTNEAWAAWCDANKAALLQGRSS